MVQDLSHYSVHDAKVLLTAYLQHYGVSVQTQWFDVIDSTNTQLLNLLSGTRTMTAAHGQRHLMGAWQQTQGRGTQKRTWHSQSHRALLFSYGVVCTSYPRVYGLSLAVGLGIYHALLDFLPQLHEHMRLKWPNDIYLNDKKLAGILIEMAAPQASAEMPNLQAPYLVIGVGLNLLPLDDEVFDKNHAYLQSMFPSMRAEDVFHLLAKMVFHMDQWIQSYMQFGVARIAQSWRQYAYQPRQLQKFTHQGQKIWAYYCNVLDDGCLHVLTAQGENVYIR